MFYRIIQRCYRSRIQYDEGPGSTMDVVQDETIHIWKEWEEADDETEESVIEYAKERWFTPRHHPDYDEEYDDRDSDPCLYRLERRKHESEEWKYVTSL